MRGKMADLVVAKDAAEGDFERLCVLRRIDLDETDMTEKEVESLAKMRSKVVKEITLGRLAIDDAGVATYTPPVADAKPLVFRMAKASTLMARDDAQAKGDHHQMIAMISDLTGVPRGELSKLHPTDYGFCATLVGLFLG
jgi:hypothetical protein